MDEKLKKYFDLCGELCAKGLSEDVALAVLQEIGKDGRVERMSVRVPQGGNGFGNGDVPATEKQLGFLTRLGIEAKEGVTKMQASNLIDARTQQD